MNEYQERKQLFPTELLDSGSVQGIEDDLSSGTTSFLDSVGFSSDCSTTRYDSISNRWDSINTSDCVKEACWVDMLKSSSHPFSSLLELEESGGAGGNESVDDAFLQEGQDLHIPDTAPKSPALAIVSDGIEEEPHPRYPISKNHFNTRCE
jgi:hypothetical protein